MFLKASEDSIGIAAKAVEQGRLIVFPTDTVYGLGCDPLGESAVARLVEAKKRDSKPVPVLCSTFEMASELVDMGSVGEALAKKHWPGALTIVAPLRRRVPFALDQGTGFLGVRVPRHEFCRELIRKVGGPLAGTSANLSGRPAAHSVEEAARDLGDSVEVYLDGGPTTGMESTVVKLTDGGLIILRQGQVGVKDE